jgi:hypothetical protein
MFTGMQRARQQSGRGVFDLLWLERYRKPSLSLNSGLAANEMIYLVTDVIYFLAAQS